MTSPRPSIIANDCARYRIDEYSDGSRFTRRCGEFSCSFSVSPVGGAPALDLVEVLDENGSPVRFNASQADEVDAILNMAQTGTPSLPAQFEPTPPANDVDAAWPNPPPGWWAASGEDPRSWNQQAKHGTESIVAFPPGPGRGDRDGCAGGGAPAPFGWLVALAGVAIVSRRRAVR
jgi:hypothetical protein